jgi:hypothetical protein
MHNLGPYCGTIFEVLFEVLFNSTSNSTSDSAKTSAKNMIFCRGFGKVLFEVLSFFLRHGGTSTPRIGTPTLIDPSIDIDRGILPAAVVVHVVAVAVIAAADIALVIVTLALALSLLPLLP